MRTLEQVVALAANMRCAAPTRCASTVGGRFPRRAVPSARPGPASRSRPAGPPRSASRPSQPPSLVGEADARQAEALREVIEREQIEERDVADQVDDHAALGRLLRGADPRLVRGDLAEQPLVDAADDPGGLEGTGEEGHRGRRL